jgi:hydrogenase/urease accessory protein HupE
MSPTGRRRCRTALAIALATAGPARAQAHLVSTGIGPFYDGIGHFLLSPDDVIPAIALALVAGMRGPKAGGWALWTLPVAWIAGGAVGVVHGAPGLSGQISSACSFLVLGGIVASDIAIPVPAVGVLAVLLGALHGFYNGTAMREAGARPAMFQLAGIGLVLFLIVLHVSELVQSLKRPWMRIVVRVAGSWIAASGLLLLGWSLRRRGA